MSIASLSIAQLKEIITVKERITSLEAQLAKIIGSNTQSKAATVAPAAPVKKPRKGISAAGKARIIAAQKARWAKVKETAPAAPAAPVPSAPAKKAKKTMSASAKAKIAAAAKARWAKIKGTTPAPAVVKAAPVAKAAVAKASPAAKPVKKKSKLTPEGRAKIVAALKKRWAAKKKS